jgi:hypothetical protein
MTRGARHAASAMIVDRSLRKSLLSAQPRLFTVRTERSCTASVEVARSCGDESRGTLGADIWIRHTLDAACRDCPTERSVRKQLSTDARGARRTPKMTATPLARAGRPGLPRRHFDLSASMDSPMRRGDNGAVCFGGCDVQRRTILWESTNECSQ